MKFYTLKVSTTSECRLCGKTEDHDVTVYSPESFEEIAQSCNAEWPDYWCSGLCPRCQEISDCEL